MRTGASNADHGDQSPTGEAGGGGGAERAIHRVPDAARPAGQASRLRQALVALDAAAAAAGWSVVALHGDATLWSVEPSPAALWAVVAAVVTVVALQWQGLYRASVASVRAIELQGVLRACLAAAAVLLVATAGAGQPLPLQTVGAGAAAAMTLLVMGRSGFRAWLRAQRRQGNRVRRVVLVGVNEEASDLWRLTRDHPEIGVRVVGAVAPRGDANQLPIMVSGHLEDAVDVIERTGATGAIVVASALPAGELNPLVRALMDNGVHVHLSSGLQGIAQRRLRALPLAYEPLFYVDGPGFASWQLVVKRAMDVVLGVLAGVLALPVLLVSAAAIKVGDRGPLLFTQERVGYLGQPFVVYKLRTMVPDAEERLEDVRRGNQRDDGPLFKLQCDPRVTRVGRLLRALSIDELPQLWNVLRGDMSLVGPRPCLPHEMEAFDDALRSRTLVKPGITGLWQVEARDNPAFGPYRRLDMFYVDNWSFTLDLGILAATAAAVCSRAAASLRWWAPVREVHAPLD